MKTEVKTVEKEFFRIPKKIYLSIIMLLIAIVILTVKLAKKYVG